MSRAALAESIVLPETERFDGVCLQTSLTSSRSSYRYAIGDAARADAGHGYDFDGQAEAADVRDVRCPIWHEQRRIVAEIEKQFSRLDEAVANLKRVKANLAHARIARLVILDEHAVDSDAWEPQLLEAELAYSRGARVS